MSIFSSLNTGVSGLNASQIRISIAGHNITNAHNDHYTRQRAVQESVTQEGGSYGLGTRVKTIVRVHDELVYNKMRKYSTKVEHTEYMKTKLEEAAQRYPDLEDAGLLKDMQAYQKAWNDYAGNPADGAMKIHLIQTAGTLANNIKNTREDLHRMQLTANQDIKLAVEEINRIAKDIASLNGQISATESIKDQHANDLRDKRETLELQLAKLVDAEIFKGKITQDSSYENQTKESSIDYYLNLNGFSLVDGTIFHPLKLESFGDDANPMDKIFYELQDGTTADLSSKLTGGVVGAALDLRGRHFIRETNQFSDGILQNYIDTMDSLASSLILNTNNIYASAAQKKVVSKDIKGLRPDDVLMTLDDRFKAGKFDLVVYDSLGKEVARKSVEIDSSTSMMGGDNTSSLIEKINSNTDDNDNHNTFDDFDDFFRAGYGYDKIKKIGILNFTPLKEGYKLGIEDNGTNFAGLLGLGQFFSGDNAHNIDVASSLKSDPMSLRASKSGADGNNDVANAINQLQYDEVEYYNADGTVNNQTFANYYRSLTTKMASIAENNNTLNATSKAIYENIQIEYSSVSGVNINEELSDLMKFQASFGASAKIITTIEKMLDTLLGIKQ